MVIKTLKEIICIGRRFNVLYIDRAEDNAFSLYDYYGHALAKEPCPEGHEIYNFLSPYPTDATKFGEDWPSSS